MMIIFRKTYSKTKRILNNRYSDNLYVDSGYSDRSKGFTLIELLIVIAIIAIVASVIFVALDPISRFRDARNAQRWQDVEAVGDAIRIYQIDNKGQVPPGVDENWKMLGTDALGCDIACGVTGEISDSYLHSNQGDFNTGVYSNTQWDNGNDWIELIVGSSGTYTSPVIDAGAINTWATLAWKPSRPTYKALPGGSESGYSAGNADMSNSVLLYHLDESSGAIVDSSGNGNSGVYNGSLYSQSGKFNSALGFDGNDDFIIKSQFNNFPSNQITVSLWIKTSDVTKNGTPFSYASSGNINDFLIYSYKNVNIIRGVSGVSTGVSFNDGFWHHLLVTWKSSNGAVNLYKDGVPVFSGTTSVGTSITSGGTLVLGQEQDGIGGGFDITQAFLGDLDEVVVWNRILEPDEVLNIYKRGALRLNLQVRSCDDAVCAGESFIGPDGTAGTYYNELNNSTTGLPSFNLANVTDSQYFQYQTSFATDNALYSPELSSVTIETMVAGEGGDTLQSSCLDLTSTLATKLPTVPEDPSDGSQEKTYYALQRDDTGQINVQACSAEGQIIKVSR